MDRTRALIGLLLIAGGVIFLLDVTEVIPAGEFFSQWWPAIFIVLGLIGLLGRPRSWFGAGMLIVIGVVLLLATLDIVDVPVWQLAVSVILIGIGLNFVLRGLGRGGTRNASDTVNAVVILGEQRVVSEATAFRRANVTSILGEATLDLRNARLEPAGAMVDSVSVLGELTIVVPRGWRVTSNGMPILGDFQDQTDHSVELPDGSPQLTITGYAILGEVKVTHSA